MEQSQVATEMKNELSDNLKQQQTTTAQLKDLTKLNESSPINKRLNGQPEVTIDNLQRFKVNNCSTANHLDNSSYQNDNSIYYTPIYNKINNNKHHKSLIETNNTHLNATATPNATMDCSFDNSIVPVASCSSLSSRRSSLNSTNFNADNICITSANKHKKSAKRKKENENHRQTETNKQIENHQSINNKQHQSTSSNRHHRRQQRYLKPPESDYNNYHLESSSELPSNSKVTNTNQNELSGSVLMVVVMWDGQQLNKHYHQSPANHQMINQAGELIFDRLSDRNSPLNTDDDSLPYFQTSSFNQDICNSLRWKLKCRKLFIFHFYYLKHSYSFLLLSLLSIFIDYFMNPIEKWKCKKKFPWKLLLQIIKIIFVTIHVLTYGSSMARFLNHQGNMAISFRELLLNNWDPVREVVSVC